MAYLLALAGCLVADGASAITPEQWCQVAKLGALGTEFEARLVCEARGLSSGPAPDCLAIATTRRDDAFRRAEQRGGCGTVGDSKQAGDLVAFEVQNVMTEQRPYGPGRSQCTQRRLLVAARAGRRLAAIFAYAEVVKDEARLLAQLARARSYSEAAYERAGAFGDCQYAYPARQAYNNLEGEIGRLRDHACPSCGLRCPCWTTAELDDRFPPGAFAEMGGISCKLESLGYITGVTSRDACEAVHAGGFSRSGFVVWVGGQLCIGSFGDLDPDGDGYCDGFPVLHTNLTPDELQVCIDDMLATRIAQEECRVPN